MEDYEEMAWTQQDKLPSPQKRGRRWLLIGGLAFAFMLALGIGVLVGSSTGAAQAAVLSSGSDNSSQPLAVTQGDTSNSQSQTFAQGNTGGFQQMTGNQGRQGQCEMLTVSSVNGTTIIAKTANGTSVTIHTTASTRYTQAGKTVAANAVKVGTRINVTGTHNSNGSITATSIDIS